MARNLLNEKKLKEYIDAHNADETRKGKVERFSDGDGLIFEIRKTGRLVGFFVSQSPVVA